MLGTCLALITLEPEGGRTHRSLAIYTLSCSEVAAGAALRACGARVAGLAEIGTWEAVLSRSFNEKPEVSRA